MATAPLHPFLLAAFPILFLFAHNLQQHAGLRLLFMPVAVALLLTGIVLGIFWLILRSVHKGAVVTSVIVLLFFSFGHVEQSIQMTTSKESWLLAVWGLAAGLSLLAMRRSVEVFRLTFILNAVGLVLVVMNLVAIWMHESSKSSAVASAALENVALDHGGTASGKPDIYYVVFDRYAAGSTLESLYGHDAQPFLDDLTRAGFYIADSSAANHLRTVHSLASSLNMSYLKELGDAYPSSDSYGPLYALLGDPLVVRSLHDLGYRYHHIGSWFGVTATSPSADVVHESGFGLEFTSVLLEASIWPTLVDRLGLESLELDRRNDREIVHGQFRAIRAVKDDPAPTFAFAHFLIPHPPYIFDRHGGPVSPDVAVKRTERENYLEQLLYTNRRIREMVADLLEGPPSEDPIIVIQADEGPYPPRFEERGPDFDWLDATGEELREKFLILNAYHLPGDHEDALYPSISPVNTFRVIFNEYFGTDLPLLPDRTYVYRGVDDLYDFVEITDRLGIPKPASP